jgi:cytidine deaminase
MRLDQRLVDAAIEFVERRFPGANEGAAAMYTEDGEILVSTALEVLNESVALCHEVGAICEAYAKNKTVTATVCVARNERGGFDILSPCGVCQERLWYWGGNVEVAVPLDHDITLWRGVTLHQASPYYWRKPYMGAANRERDRP